MYHLKDPLFYAVFNQLHEPKLIIKADQPDFTIVTSNLRNDMLLRAEERLSGRSLWDIRYPESFGGDNDSLRKGLQAALSQKHDIILEPFFSKSFQSNGVYWLQLAINPILDEGNVSYLILTVFDRTRELQDKTKIQQLHDNERELLKEQQELNDELAAANEELTAMNDDLHQSQEQLLLLNQQLETRVAERTQELFLSEQKAKLIINDAPVGMSVVTGKQLIVESANSKMLEFWNRTEEIIGMPLLEALPELAGQSFPVQMEQVLLSGEPRHGYESRAMLQSGAGGFERYYDFVYQPVKNESGETVSVLIVASDVSSQVKAKKEVEASRFWLEKMVMSTPFALAILKGREMRIDIANTPMLNIWARTYPDVLGKKLMDVFPELEWQPFPDLLKTVFDTGERISMPEVLAKIAAPDGRVNEHYLHFSYDPLFDPDGGVDSILVSVSDITEVILARKQLQDRQEMLEALNEEVAAGNEELVAINEELTASNHELLQTEQQLQSLYNRLAESEDLFRGIFEQSPLGMCLLRGPEHIIELANENTLEIWGRKASDVLHLPHRIARPELKGQPVYDWLDEVYRTGEPKVNPEFKVYLYAGEGIKREAYVNSVYQPLRDAKGAVYGILVIIDEVTERVYERKQTEAAFEQFRLAVESASLGTWYIDVGTKQLTASPRLNELFGFCPEEQMSFEDTIERISGEYRDKVLLAINRAIESEEEYNMEYSISRRSDGKLRWLKATGKLYKTTEPEMPYFSGTVQDITEQKQEESRKNAFIAMASHELKTPLTSAKAYVQMLALKSKKADDDFSSKALAKVELQINKMQALISGFLDVARVESGNLKLNKAPFFMDQLILQVTEELGTISPHHHVVIEQNEPSQTHADSNKIAQVLENLLSNAIKYSPAGGNVYVNCNRTAEYIQVSIRDEGLGIAAHDMQGLFSRFYRVETPNTAHISGFGVGLYICSEIIKRHGGTIWAESTAGSGSTFYFTIPMI